MLQRCGASMAFSADVCGSFLASSHRSYPAFRTSVFYSSLARYLTGGNYRDNGYFLDAWRGHQKQIHCAGSLLSQALCGQQLYSMRGESEGHAMSGQSCWRKRLTRCIPTSTKWSTTKWNGRAQSPIIVCAHSISFLKEAKRP